MEGIDRVRSSHAAIVEHAAGRGRGRVMVWLWKNMNLVEERFIWRSSCIRERQILPPAESPARTMWDAGTGVWKDSGGG